MQGEPVVCVTPEECATRLAATLVEHLRARLRRVAKVHLALSGGSSGKLLCAALARDDLLRESEWARLHLWLVDERCVPADDPRLNFGLVRDALAPHVPLPARNLHPMPVLQKHGAERYERQLRDALAERQDRSERRLDAVVLGMGDDGHTASLFPGSPALEERERFIVLNDGEQVTPPRPRMTMTLPVLSSALLIALLVTGQNKRPALQRLATNVGGNQTLPVARVIPDERSRMLWFLDAAALPR